MWYRSDDNCLYGVRGYPMIFNFSVVTQQTIGVLGWPSPSGLALTLQRMHGVSVSSTQQSFLTPHGVHVAGYGNTGPNNCAWASLVLVVQTIFGLLLDAITIGVLFARISHPQQRARSVGHLFRCVEWLQLAQYATG